MERWPSGLRRTPGKCVEVKASRGFESLSLRHVLNYVMSYYVINLGWVSILLTKALDKNILKKITTHILLITNLPFIF